MQLIADYFPLILFFIAFKWQGIYFATGVAIAASLAIILVFGGATLLLHDEVFIKWKPTVLYGLFGAILAGGRLLFRRNLLAHLMTGISLPDPVWSRLTWAWVGFFAFMAVLNWYVAFNFSTDTWVNFKVWGGIGLFLVFALAQGMLLARHVREETP